MSTGHWKYLIWRYDCDHCGEVIDYGEDDPELERCETCGERFGDGE